MSKKIKIVILIVCVIIIGAIIFIKFPTKAKIEQEAYEIYGNDYCTGHSGEIAGCALTDYKCTLCRRKATSPTTRIHEICDWCAERTGRCGLCGCLKVEQ